VSNINVTKGTTDTADNSTYKNIVAPPVDYSGIALLVLTIAGIITVVWLLLLATANVSCWWKSEYECTTANYIFWGYVVIIVLIVLIGVGAAVPSIYQKVRNMSYLFFRGIALHRDSVREHALALIDVAKTSAESEATAGIDTYSPSIARTYTAPPAPIAPAIDDTGGGDMTMEDFITATNK
jgi:hypothetical protein